MQPILRLFFLCSYGILLSELDLEVGSLRTTDSVHQHFTEAIGAPTWTRAEPRRCCARTRSTAPDARVDLRESASARSASSCLFRTVSTAPAGRCRKVPQSLFAD